MTEFTLRSESPRRGKSGLVSVDCRSCRADGATKRNLAVTASLHISLLPSPSLCSRFPYFFLSLFVLRFAHSWLASRLAATSYSCDTRTARSRRRTFKYTDMCWVYETSSIHVPRRVCSLNLVLIDKESSVDRFLSSVTLLIHHKSLCERVRASARSRFFFLKRFLNHFSDISRVY